jgi:hypothetical protein
VSPNHPSSQGLQARVPLVKGFAQEGFRTLGTIRGNGTKKSSKIVLTNGNDHRNGHSLVSNTIK